MPAELSGKFGQRLRAAMADQRIGILKLSTLTGIDQKSIIRYRNGHVEPRDPYGHPTANAWKLARALGIEVDQLLPPPEPEPESVAA